MSESRHPVRFPGESESYRTARNELLDAEMQLRSNIEAVARMRRDLPLGGELAEDYVFDEAGDGSERQVRLADFFAERKDTLTIYTFISVPKMTQPSRSSTSTLNH